MVEWRAMRPIRVRFDSAALRHNLSVAKRRAPQSRVWAVVKANAYGHGLARAARAFAPAEGLALIELEAALELRRSGERRPILLLQGFFSAEELEPIAAHGLTTVVHDPEQLAMLENFKLSTKIPAYLKLNTGMNRLGFSEDGFRDALERLKRCAGEITLMTHFADADGKRGVQWQSKRFKAMTEGVKLSRSLANSAAILRYPEAHTDWVRPGIMLYGCSPFADEGAAKLGLKPAMTLSSELIVVRNLRKGDSVGYGCTFIAAEPMRIGIVACGYADGYPRHAPIGTASFSLSLPKTDCQTNPSWRYTRTCAVRSGSGPPEGDWPNTWTGRFTRLQLPTGWPTIRSSLSAAIRSALYGSARTTDCPSFPAGSSAHTTRRTVSVRTMCARLS